MSNTPDMSSFGKFVPGFDFLQNLAKQAAGGAAQSIPQLPNLGNWVAPTLNVEELDKRIEELKAVQFWLDQNAMALKATIQALEVQKMTLATLKGMNFNFGDVANAFKLKAADSMMSGMQKVTEKASDAAATVGGFAGSVSGTVAPKKAAVKKSTKSTTQAVVPAMPAGMVDPMQLWSALTKQFGEIAAGAMKDAAKQTAIDVTKGVATDMAKGAFKKATDMAGNVANTMTGGMAGAVGKAMTSANAASKKPAKKAAAKKRSR
ncbi:MAG: PhaM family polyhydroxyalkanoate granule multifunctional regulatory protein [Burkholderiaceae bacterium]